MVKGDGPFTVLERVGDNAYNLDMAVSATFNVGNLSPYMEDNLEYTLYLRLNPLEGK